MFETERAERSVNGNDATTANHERGFAAAVAAQPPGHIHTSAQTHILCTVDGGPRRDAAQYRPRITERAYYAVLGINYCVCPVVCTRDGKADLIGPPASEFGGGGAGGAGGAGGQGTYLVSVHTPLHSLG